jgi:hypothetical protein
MCRKKSLIGPLIPYVSVAVFLYGMNSAWGAMIGYHAGALALIVFSSRMNGTSTKSEQNNGWVLPLAVIFALGGVVRCLRSGGLLIPVITHIIADVSIVIAVHFRLFA